MKVQELRATDVVVNPTIKTRKGELDQDTIDRLALNFQERAENNQEPQMQPGLVRINAAGKHEIIDGAHRHAAVMFVNEQGGIKGEPLPFLAYVVREDDMDAIVSSIVANEYRKATNIFDRAEAMQKLIDLGKTQVQVAAIFSVDQATVSQTLAAGTLEKKYVKAVLEGDMEQDAAIVLASMPVDSAKRTEIFDLCIKHRNRIDEVMQRREIEKAKEAADVLIKEAKVKQDEAEAALKAQVKVIKSADNLLAKTKDELELAEGRKAKEAAMKAAKEAEKLIAATTKALDKAKKRKEELTTKAAAVKQKSKVNPEEVKRQAKGAGVTSVKNAPMQRKDFIALLQVFYEDHKTGTNLLPQSALDLLATLEAMLDGEKSTTQFRNALLKFCVPDAVQAAPPKVAPKAATTK